MAKDPLAGHERDQGAGQECGHVEAPIADRGDREGEGWDASEVTLKGCPHGSRVEDVVS